MMKSAEKNIWHSHILLLVLLLLACNNSSWAGVAAYQLDGGTTVPAPISYWLSGDATSVTIDIIDASTSSVVHTFPVLTGADATKGFHSAAVTWDGAAAPAGNYKVRATVLSDMTTTDSKLKPLWESCSADGTDSTDWRLYGIAMNVNPQSPFYGRVYVGNYTAGGHSKAVHEFNPDGTEISPPLPEPAEGFGGSSPWGLCVDADDHVYTANRSDSSGGGSGRAVWQYHWDGSQWVCSPMIGIQYHRYLGCNFAAGSSLKLAFSYQEGGAVKMHVGSGDPPTTFAIGSTQTSADYPMQPAIDAGGAVYIAAYRQSSPALGALQQWDYSTKAIVATNTNLTQSMGVAITTNDATMWLARPNAFTTWDSEKSPFYKFPKSQAMTITPSSLDLKKYAWGTVYQATQSPRFIAVDGESNLAVAGTDGSSTGKGSVFGLYAEPTGVNTSEVRVGRNVIVKGVYVPAITGVITEGSSGNPAAGVTVRATKGAYYGEGVTNAAGVYVIDVLPDTGYTIAPVTNIYKNTLPTEYNLQSNWPSDPGTTDWPQAADVTAGNTTTLNGRVWPLAVTQVTYDWAVPVYRTGGRTVCVTGTVLRHAADSTVTPIQKGYDGYYFLTDLLGSPGFNTQQAVKVNVFSKGSDCKKGDRVVVVGTFDVPTNYRQGVVTPTSAPTVLSSGNPLPEPRDATALTHASLYGNVIGGYYFMQKTVTRVGDDGEFYVQVPNSAIDPALVEFRIGMDTIATTGVGYPSVGQAINIYGVLDELAPSNTLRALLPGEPGDAGPQGLVADIAAAKAKADGADVAFASAQVTATAGGGIPADIAYIEQPDRTSALRVHLPGLVSSDIGPGDLVLIQGSMSTTAQGERFVEAIKFSRIASGASARPIDAVGMGNNAAKSGIALGMFIKTWGKVSAVDGNSFTMSDGSRTPLKVLCGSLTKPETGRLVRVRGIMSKDASGDVLYMRNEQVDWQYGEESYQPTSLPGAYKYPRDFLVLGPFADGYPVTRSYRLDHDFILDATAGAYDEETLTNLGPMLGGSVGSKTWVRSQATGDNVTFAAVFPTGNTNCTFYAHLWLYSPTGGHVGLRVGSCDSAKVFVNGYQVYATSPVVARAETQGQNVVPDCYLYNGLNSILLKVEHGTTNTPGIDIQFVDSGALGSSGWGKATPLQGYGYLLNTQ